MLQLCCTGCCKSLMSCMSEVSRTSDRYGPLQYGSYFLGSTCCLISRNVAEQLVSRFPWCTVLGLQVVMLVDLAFNGSL